jgi:hypothetical protein
VNLNLNTKIGRLLPIIIKFYVPIIILLLLVLLVNNKTQIPIATFTKDSAAIAGLNGLSSLVKVTTNPFVGVVSNIGILFWCTCASICFFTDAILRNEKDLELSQFKVFADFFRCFGIVTSILLIDDLFLFHETIAPKLFKVSQKAVYFSYALLVAWAIIRYRKTIVKTEWSILFLAFVFFALSLTMDEFITWIYPVKLAEDGLPALIEDGFKLLGIASWCVYFTKVCFQAIDNFIKAQFTQKASIQFSDPSVFN